MILGISEDFTTSTELDSELTAIPSSGLYLNSGTHPSITVENLLEFLSFFDPTLLVWSESNTYT